MKKFVASAASAAIALSLAAPSFALAATETVNIACMKTAVEKRENAIQPAVTAYQSSVNSALSTRKTALIAAWNISDKNQRRNSIKDARKNFETSVKNARKTEREQVKNIWTTFKSEAKTCKGSNEESDSSSADGAL